MVDVPTKPRDERPHLCAVCSDRGTPWVGLRGEHQDHDEGMNLVSRLGAGLLAPSQAR